MAKFWTYRKERWERIKWPTLTRLTESLKNFLYRMITTKFVLRTTYHCLIMSRGTVQLDLQPVCRLSRICITKLGLFYTFLKFYEWVCLDAWIITFLMPATKLGKYAHEIKIHPSTSWERYGFFRTRVR